MQHDYAVDSHAHVLDPVAAPFTNPHGHVPGPNECGTSDEYRVVLAAHGMTHGLLVNPFAGYGTDNAYMLSAIAASNGRIKGVALIDHDASDAHLRALTDGGVIGARFNTLFTGATSLHGATGQRTLERIRDLGWFAQIYYQDDSLLDLLPVLKATGIKVVVDHCGCPDPRRGLSQPAFQALLELGRSGHAAVKLSGAFRFSHEAWPYADTEPYVAALLEAFTPDNCMWGSDWPYVRVPRRMDYGPIRALLSRWVPDPATQRKILWDTPARWCGFTTNDVTASA